MDRRNIKTILQKFL